jgi:hypothetical protein
MGAFLLIHLFGLLVNMNYKQMFHYNAVCAGLKFFTFFNKLK